MKHDAIWTAPDALRRADKTAHAPMLLRFADDSFMDALQALLRDAPERLPEYRARFETWRDGLLDPTPTKPASALAKRMGIKVKPQALNNAPAAATRPPKLYQPAHQRHYLVAAQLVCETAGFPDRAIDRGQQEQAGFVLRRLLPLAGQENAAPETWDEYAFVANTWRKTAGQKLLVTDEEILPVFPLAYRENERPRRLLDAWQGAGGVEDRLGVEAAEDLEGDAAGEVGLDDAVDDVDAGPLGF